MNIKRKFSHSVSVNQPESSVCRSPRTKGRAANANTSDNTLCDLEGGKNGDDILLLSDKLRESLLDISPKWRLRRDSSAVFIAKEKAVCQR